MRARRGNPAPRTPVTGTDQPPLDRSPVDATRLGLARERARHVVVLMLENRAFDHVLAFSGHPGLTPLDPAQHRNRVPWRASGGEPPNGDGTAMLGGDPPHSHDAAKRQMGTPVGGVAPMDGFVEAYKLKLDGKEHLPVVHWRRLFGAAAVLSPLLGGAASTLWRRAQHGWGGLGPWVAVPTGVLGAAALARPLGRASRVAGWRIALAVLVGGSVAGAGAEAIAGAGRRRGPAIGLWTLPAAAALAAVVERQRRAHARRLRRRPDAAERALAVMGCLPAGEVPVLGALAQQFAVCERWFSSVPGATWPNRNFLHAGTSAQSVDIEIGLYQDRTVFELLDDAASGGASDGARGGASDGAMLTDPAWRIYADGTPQVFCFERLWRAPEQAERWCAMDDFHRHAADGTLASYSFIEPRHSGAASNSMHPGNNLAVGEDDRVDLDRAEILVRDVYQAIGRRPGGWESTVLVVTFDEHGGTFDRARPPRTVAPGTAAAVRHPVITLRRFVAWFVEHRNAPFDFRRCGLRVPTLVISPWVAQGGVDRHDYDHTSVPETVRQLFAPGQAPLGRRAARARPFWDLLVASARPRPMPPAPEPRRQPRRRPGADRDTGAARSTPGAGEAGAAPDAGTGTGTGTGYWSPFDATTGGDLPAQMLRLEELAAAELDRRPGAAVTARAGAETVVERFRQWARRADGQR